MPVRLDHFSSMPARCMAEAMPELSGKMGLIAKAAGKGDFAQQLGPLGPCALLIVPLRKQLHEGNQQSTDEHRHRRQPAELVSALESPNATLDTVASPDDDAPHPRLWRHCGLAAEPRPREV
jgi:hypothetical protein